MSFQLTNSNNLYCSARSDQCGKGFLDNKVVIGDYEIDIQDFCAFVEYVLTNTDLEEDDQRIHLVNNIKKYIVVSGFNRENIRFEINNVDKNTLPLCNQKNESIRKECHACNGIYCMTTFQCGDRN